jgi:hypothetical protein
MGKEMERWRECAVMKMRFERFGLGKKAIG